MKSSISTVIFMRIISPFVIKTPWGLERFLAFPLLLLSVRVALRSRPGLLPTSTHTATVCVLCLCGKDAFSCSTWHRWFHKHVQLLSGILKNGVKVFNSVKKNIVIVLLLACSLKLGFIKVPLLLCFLLGTCGNGRPHFWPNRFWSRCDLCSGQSTIHQ